MAIKKNDRNEKIYQGYMDGMSISELSINYDLAQNTIANIISFISSTKREENERNFMERRRREADINLFLHDVHAKGLTYAQAQIKETCALINRKAY